MKPQPGSVPDWFTTNRVHGHTRLILKSWGGKPGVDGAAARFNALGAHAFTRHAKSGKEDPPWPPWSPPPDVVKDYIDRAHAEGMRIFVYYWHESHESLEGPHPDWICKTHAGRQIRGPRGVWLDITGPYREVVLGHLRELADMGADGFFFDHRHLPPKGCWGSALADAWRQDKGEEAPGPNDPKYLEFLDFKAEKIEETFVYWRDQIKSGHPNVVFIVSTTTIPALTDREMTTRLVYIADSAKNEYCHALNDRFSKGVFESGVLKEPEGHVRQALGWTVLRDASDGRPPHIWARGVPNADHACAYAASLLTFGCVANMDVHEYLLVGRTDIPETKTPPEALEKAFALGTIVSPHLAGTRPVRWAAIHFSERIRDQRGADYQAAWREVLWPLVGTFQVLTQDGLPVGVVNDQQLERGELDGYRVLIVTNRNQLTLGQEEAVVRFRARGGRVIENDPLWAWSDPGGNAAAAAAFRAALRPFLGTAPVLVSGQRTGRYAVSYRHPDRLVVAVTNDFSWVQIRWKPDNENQRAPAAKGLRVMWRKEHMFPAPGLLSRLSAIEVIKHKELTVVESDQGYQVELPDVDDMALVVVTRARRWPFGLNRQRVTRSREMPDADTGQAANP
jgi:hypothetical protein